MVRWADDFIILVGSQQAGERVLDRITKFVEGKLKLKGNEHKSRVVPVRRSKFLGFSFRGNNLVWHEDAYAKLKWKIRERTNRSQGKSMERIIKEWSTYLRGWVNYFGIAQGYQKGIDLGHWIRRRLRRCYWKQWRKTKTKIRNLKRLGTIQERAVNCGVSGKSYWHSARTAGIHQALTNEFLAKQGLISLRERWVDIHYK